MKRLFLAFVFSMIAGDAFATQRVWIAEFGLLAQTGAAQGQAQIAPLPVLAKQQVDTTGGVQTSAAFSKSTFYIRVVCEAQCAVSGTAPATVTDILLPPYTPEYFGVLPGSTISVIAAP
jgi:hypothetical protein